jgi:hypothetical protein
LERYGSKDGNYEKERPSIGNAMPSTPTLLVNSILQRGFNGRQSLGHGSAGYLAASFKTFDCVERNYGLLCEVAPIPRKETTRRSDLCAGDGLDFTHSAPRTSLDHLVGPGDQL